MNLKEIKEQLLKAAELVGDFEQSGLEIDRDTALDIIRRAYESLRFTDVASVVASVPVVEEAEECEPEVEVEFIMPEEVEEEVLSVEEESVVEPESEPEPEVEPEIEVEVVVTEPEEEVVSEVDPEPEVEVEVAVESEPESEPMPEPEPAPKKVVVEPSLFGDESLWGRPAAKSQSKIMALYDDEEVVEEQPKQPKSVVEVVAEPEVKPIEKPAAEPVVVAAVHTIADVEPAHQVLGEVIEAPKTIADTIAPVESVAESSSVENLRGVISVVDRFMLIRDLFGDNEALYEQTIDILDRMDNLDDCIIYIAENFVWRPSSDGAKLIMDLLQRKFR